MKEKPPEELLSANLPTFNGKGSKKIGIGTFFFFMQSAGYGSLSFLDAKLGPKDISPLVSLTGDPETAYKFATNKNKTGRLIVLSVPKKEIKSRCSKIEKPGSIANYFNCVKKDSDDETSWERELNSVLYIHPRYVLFSLDATK